MYTSVLFCLSINTSDDIVSNKQQVNVIGYVLDNDWMMINIISVLEVIWTQKLVNRTYHNLC